MCMERHPLSRLLLHDLHGLTPSSSATATAGATTAVTAVVAPMSGMAFQDKSSGQSTNCLGLEY